MSQDHTQNEESFDSTQDKTKEAFEENYQEQKEQTPEEPNVVEQNVDYKDMAMRAQADYQNLQKEVREQRASWAKMSELQILEEFIPIYNNFKTAFAHPVSGNDESQWENWKKGIEFIKKQFSDVLSNHAVQEIETVGKEFDPNLHEAVSEEASDEYNDGIIIREVTGGYKAGDRVIQAARVVVCKKN